MEKQRQGKKAPGLWWSILSKEGVLVLTQRVWSTPRVLIGLFLLCKLRSQVPLSKIM